MELADPILEARSGRWLVQRIRVAPELQGQRLDRFLQDRFPWRSRTWVQRLVRDHARDATGRPLKPARLVRAGDEVLLCFQRPPALPKPDLDVQVLFEDEELFVIDKPAGFPVHARGRMRHLALIHLLREKFPTAGLDLGHRLDRETSGVLLLTKNQRANGHLKNQLRRGSIHKEYLAVVRGRPSPEEFSVDLPLRPAHTSAIRMKMEAHPEGAAARTEFRVVERTGEYALVRAQPRTGRQHQIRVHLAAVGHPVVGDKIYGAPEEVFLHFAEHGFDDHLRGLLELPRQALHASAAEITHPSTGQRLRIESPLPGDLSGFLARAHASTAGETCDVSMLEM